MSGGDGECLVLYCDNGWWVAEWWGVAAVHNKVGDGEVTEGLLWTVVDCSYDPRVPNPPCPFPPRPLPSLPSPSLFMIISLFIFN